MSILDEIRENLAQASEVVVYEVGDQAFNSVDEANMYSMLSAAQLLHQNDSISWEELQEFYADFVRWIY